jgi:hypothetical protein
MKKYFSSIANTAVILTLKANDAQTTVGRAAAAQGVQFNNQTYLKQQ